MSILIYLVLSTPLTILAVIYTIRYAVYSRDGVSAEFSFGPFKFALKTTSRNRPQVPESMDHLSRVALGEPPLTANTANEVLADGNTSVTSKHSDVFE